MSECPIGIDSYWLPLWSTTHLRFLFELSIKNLQSFEQFGDNSQQEETPQHLYSKQAGHQSESTFLISLPGYDKIKHLYQLWKDVFPAVWKPALQQIALVNLNLVSNYPIHTDYTKRLGQHSMLRVLYALLHHHWIGWRCGRSKMILINVWKLGENKDRYYITIVNRSHSRMYVWVLQKY